MRWSSRPVGVVLDQIGHRGGVLVGQVVTSTLDDGRLDVGPAVVGPEVLGEDRHGRAEHLVAADEQERNLDGRSGTMWNPPCQSGMRISGASSSSIPGSSISMSTTPLVMSGCSRANA